MPRSLLYIGLTLVFAAAGVVSGRHESDSPLIAPSPAENENRFANCGEAIVAARRSPYWRNQSFAVDCRTAPGGWRLTASTAEPNEQCELYVGRDRLIVPRLPCQGVGVLEGGLR